MNIQRFHRHRHYTYIVDIFLAIPLHWNRFDLNLFSPQATLLIRSILCYSYPTMRMWCVLLFFYFRVHWRFFLLLLSVYTHCVMCLNRVESIQWTTAIVEGQLLSNYYAANAAQTHMLFVRLFCRLRWIQINWFFEVLLHATNANTQRPGCVCVCCHPFNNLYMLTLSDKQKMFLILYHLVVTSSDLLESKLKRMKANRFLLGFFVLAAEIKGKTRWISNWIQINVNRFPIQWDKMKMKRIYRMKTKQ